MKDLRNPQLKKTIKLPDGLEVQYKARRLNITGRALAKEFGKTEQQISQAFNGRQPGLLLRIYEHIKPMSDKAIRKQRRIENRQSARAEA